MKKIRFLCAAACMLAFGANAQDPSPGLPDGWLPENVAVEMKASGEIELTFPGSESLNPWDAQFITPSWKKIGLKGDSFKLSFEVKYEGEAENGKFRPVTGKTVPYQPDFANNNSQIVDKYGNVRVYYDDFVVPKQWTLYEYDYYIGEQGEDSIRLEIDLGYVPGKYSIRNMSLKVAGFEVESYFTDVNGEMIEPEKPIVYLGDFENCNQWFTHSEGIIVDSVAGVDTTAVAINVSSMGLPWDVQFCNIFNGLEGQSVGNTFELSFNVYWESATEVDSAKIWFMTGKNADLHENYQWEDNTEIVDADGNRAVHGTTQWFKKDEWTTLTISGLIGEKGANYIGIQMNLASDDSVHPNKGTFYFNNIDVKIAGKTVRSYYDGKEPVENEAATADNLQGWSFAGTKNETVTPMENIVSFTVPNSGDPWNVQFIPPTWYAPSKGNKEAFELSFDAKYDGNGTDGDGVGHITFVQGRQFGLFKGDLAELCQKLGVGEVGAAWELQNIVEQLIVTSFTGGHDENDGYEHFLDREVYFSPTGEWQHFTMKGYLGRHAADSVDIEIDMGKVGGDYSFRNVVFSVEGEEFAKYFTKEIVEETGDIKYAVSENGEARVLGVSNAELKTVTIPATIEIDSVFYPVTAIGAGAFKNCTKLASVSIPSSVTMIGSEAFYGCASLTSIELPASVTTIGDNTFRYCKSLKTVSISDDMKKISSSAFIGCNSLEYNEFSNALYLGNAKNKYVCLVSAKSTEIASCEINSGCTVIFPKAFEGCAKLTSINIPASVKNIGSGAFDGCDSIKTLTYNTDAVGDLFRDKSSLKTVVVGDSVKAISNSAFSGCWAIESITLGKSVEKIGSYAFNWCTSLKSIAIPESVTSIGEYAFEKCKKLKSVVLPDAITYINSYTFSGCDSLKSVAIPNSVTRIYDHAFENCGSLESVVIPNSVNRIDDYAFAGDTSLTSVVLPESLSYIGYYAFDGCKKLKSVVIPNAVESIGGYTFRNCSSLESVTMGDNITEIGDWAFAGCTSLTSFDIPNSVTTIGNDAFTGDTLLKSVTIPESVTNIGHGVFNTCSSLESVTLPSGLRRINSYQFFACRKLTSMVVPYNVDEISNCAFMGCWNLNSITIGKNVSYIGTDVFKECDSLKTITILRSNPPYSYDSFDRDSAGLSKITLRVPEGSKNDYLTTVPWDKMNIVEFGIRTVTLNANREDWGELYGADVYELNSEVTVSAKANYGFQFVKWSDGNTDNPRTLKLTQDTTLTAVFDVKCYTVTLLADNVSQGYVEGNTIVQEGSWQSYYAYGVGQYKFDHWSTGETYYRNSFIVTSDTTITAYFKKTDICQVVLSSDDYVKGTVSMNTTCLAGTSQYVWATANEGYRFVMWSDSNKYSGRYISVSSDTNLVAYFEALPKYNVKFAVADSCKKMGRVVYDGSSSVYENNYVSVYAVADSGYTFAGWYKADGTLLRKWSDWGFDVVRDTAAFACFKALPSCVVEFAVADSCKKMGKVVYNGSKVVAKYQSVTAVAVADSGYLFYGWYYANGDLYSNAEQIWFEAEEDTTSLFARFRKFDYVCVPQSGFDTLNLKAGEKVKFYDYGGPKYGYQGNNSGVLVINAPEGYVIEISGKYDVGKWDDYIHLYNGADNHIAEWTGKDSASIIIPNTVAGVRFNSYYNYNQQAGFELQAAAVKLADAVQYKVDVAVNDTALGNAFVNYFVKVDSSSYDVVLSAQAKRGGRFNNWMGNNYNSDPTITVKSDTILKAVFDTLQSYTVTFQSSDTTLGYVQGYKSGVYYEGDWVYIEACTKSAASSFVKWSDGVKDSWRSFYPQKDTTLVAEFKRNDVCKVNINVNDSTLGNVVIGDTGTYYVGQEIYVYTVRNKGAFLVDWSDGSTSSRRWITLTGDTTITANFEAMPYKVNVQINDSAAGLAYFQVSERINSHIYRGSVEVSHTEPGYVFKNWSDGYVSKVHEIYVTSDTTIVANFEPINYDIKYVSENGNIYWEVPQVADSVFTVKTSVFANEGYCFAGWQDSVMLTSRTFAVNSDTALIANFVEFPYNVNIVCDSVKGSVSYSTRNSTLENPQIEFSVLDNDGYVFSHWSNGSYDRDMVVTLSSDTTFTAYFNELPVQVLLAVNDTAMGTVSHRVYGWDDNYVEMEFWAKANPFYHFVMWSDSVTDRSRYEKFTSDTTITAIFAPNRYVVSLAANDTAMGSVRVSADTADYRSTDTLFATPAAGYHFVMWNDSVTENPRVITINGNMKFTAIFEINTYKVEFAAENGTVDGAGVFTHGDTATFTAKAAEGYHFSKWSDGNTDNPRTLVVTDSVKFTAVFDINVYKVEAKAENGTVEGAGEYKHGEVATLNAKAADGFHFSKWSDGNTDNPRKVTVTDNVSLTAVFEQDAPSTAIDESTENAVNIFAYSNVIVVENADAEIYIYDSMGRLVERNLGNDARVEIIVNNGGAYIVKVGNTAKRVMVNY